MDFVKLRLTGFKSFVDGTELVIEPGMTGVVGPNGCGKSNLVEALRWGMGETSARRMRGEEMDDVIFGGTARRPARNIAEVTLLLDNSSRTAPAGFNDSSELEVSRRIERGAGSDYRINGKVVRARDVQLLFADNASGASSPALVSQGQIGALIRAKPQDRRQLLEEAAGITGLHSRRHEAELRLRGAETNLTRLDDVIGAMDGQFQGLKKQARQAARYRNLSEMIRRAEAVLWHLRWQAAEIATTTALHQFEIAESSARDLMGAVASLTTRRVNDATGLPDLRQAEAAAAAALQRMVLAKEQLDAEERRVLESQTANRRRLDQVRGDLKRENSLAADADGAVNVLNDEREDLTAAQDDEEMLAEAGTESLLNAREQVEVLDRDLTAKTERVASDEAKRGALVRQVQDLTQKLAAADQRLASQRSQLNALEAELAARPDLACAEAMADAAGDRLEETREAADAAEQAKQTAEAKLGRLREVLQTAESARAKLKAEAMALTELLHGRGGSGDLFPPLIDAVTVTPGYEGALAAALGDDLTAPLNDAAAIYWRSLPPYEQIPELLPGVTALTDKVKGPAALNRRLGFLGIVADAATGARLMAQLLPGQTIVTRDGAAWRWDGLTVTAGAPSAAAIRLKQRNRLEELLLGLEAAEERVEEARNVLDEAKRAVADAVGEEKRRRDAAREAFTSVNQARDHHAKLVRESVTATSRLSAVTEQMERLEAERVESDTRLIEARNMLAAQPETGPAREMVSELRARLAEHRTLLAERQSQLDRMTRDAQSRRQRLAAIEAEVRSWRSRQTGAGSRLDELTERAATAEAELLRLADRPAEIEADRQALFTCIADAERARKRAADTLVEAETRLADTEKQLKRAETGLADVREARARAEALVASTRQHETDLRERIQERLECDPAAALALSGIAPGDVMPEAGAVESRLERLVRERENMGPVNLRAEMEAAELEAQITSLTTERTDLTAAIARLRQGISSLNKEARERLLASFEKVNLHFQELFVKMFGGGRAHLELTEAADPLDAGLEIFASPPGKRLQILTLLSGGEQALTALSLLFAVFLTNPAPICVLDEVDAPLDEANVGRFCDMVQDMAAAGRTRFLVITHHRLTMARTDRLFGVTMAEQGVSQLVSVDLRAAEALRAVG
ncbi:MAG: chromosome segregation protein SMC [Rhodospirillaceae bacterium]